MVINISVFSFFPCSADHERDWPPCKVVFFGLATNALNVRNFCFRSKRVDRCVGVEHEEYLEAVDLTSCVGTIPTWLASYFLV